MLLDRWSLYHLELLLSYNNKGVAISYSSTALDGKEQKVILYLLRQLTITPQSSCYKHSQRCSWMKIVFVCLPMCWTCDISSSVWLLQKSGLLTYNLVRKWIPFSNFYIFIELSVLCFIIHFFLPENFNDNYRTNRTKEKLPLSAARNFWSSTSAEMPLSPALHKPPNVSQIASRLLKAVLQKEAPLITTIKSEETLGSIRDRTSLEERPTSRTRFAQFLH